MVPLWTMFRPVAIRPALLPCSHHTLLCRFPKDIGSRDLDLGGYIFRQKEGLALSVVRQRDREKRRARISHIKR